MNKSKIKVLRIQSRICVGGPAVHTEILARYLDTDKYDTILVGGALEEGEKSRIPLLRKQGINVTTIPQMGRELSPVRDLSAIVKLYRLIREIKPDIVHTHTAKAGAIGRIAARLAGVPIIIHTFHGHVFRHYFGKLKTRFFQILERVLALISTRIVVISPAQFHDIVDVFKIAPAKKTQVIRLGFELERFLFLEKNDLLKESLNLSEDTFLLGIIGRLVPIKNHEMALRVLALLHKKRVPAHLCIVGDGELRELLEQHVKEMELVPFVHFLGWRLDVENIYAGIDTLILTSLNEGTPVAIVEAMASQVPVVATNVGGVRDLIVDQETGMLCPPNDSPVMVSKIQQIYESKSLRERLVKNAREFAIKTYSYKRLVSEIEALYVTLLAEKASNG